ncbi:MAG TPA: formate dehydrogenase subunit gamma [Burkholderiales bacterium]
MGQQSFDWVVRIALALLLTVSGGAWAQQEMSAQQQAQREITQPGNNAPYWREVRGRDAAGGTVGVSTVTGREAGVLIQSEGQTWREVRNGPLTQIGGWLLALAFIGVMVFYAIKGSISLREPETGRRIQRFSLWERVLHWTTAITFLTLAFSGLAMLFGRYILVPIIGHGVFSWIAVASKTLHNFIGPLFIVCTLAMFFTFVKDNIWRSYDGEWLRRFGGLLSKGHDEPKSHRFNAGEKAWFWGGLSLLGLVVGFSGLVLDFPNFDQSRQTMQFANIVHLIGATLFMVGAMGHIYMGTIGMRGAFNAMKTGEVDETWAKEHHYYWYEDVKAGRIPSADSSSNVSSAGRSPAPGTTN